MLYRLVKSVAALLLRIFFRLRVTGEEQIPREGPLLVVANHVSLLDPPAVAASSPRPLYFLAKAELFGVPLLGRLIRSLNALPLNREGPDAAALRQALALLAEGKALLVFPEGTRGQEGVLRAGKAGAGMLAALSGAQVVPAYVRGTGVALPRGRAVPRPSSIRVAFGPPLRFETGRRGKAYYREVSARMMEAIGRLKEAMAPDRAPAKVVSPLSLAVDALGGSPAGQIQ